MTWWSRPGLSIYQAVCSMTHWKMFDRSSLFHMYICTQPATPHEAQPCSDISSTAGVVTNTYRWKAYVMTSPRGMTYFSSHQLALVWRTTSTSQVFCWAMQAMVSAVISHVTFWGAHWDVTHLTLRAMSAWRAIFSVEEVKGKSQPTSAGSHQRHHLAKVSAVSPWNKSFTFVGFFSSPF